MPVALSRLHPVHDAHDCDLLQVTAERSAKGPRMALMVHTQLKYTKNPTSGGIIPQPGSPGGQTPQAIHLGNQTRSSPDFLAIRCGRSFLIRTESDLRLCLVNAGIGSRITSLFNLRAAYQRKRPLFFQIHWFGTG